MLILNLVNPLIIPMRVELAKFHRDSIVLPGSTVSLHSKFDCDDTPHSYHRPESSEVSIYKEFKTIIVFILYSLYPTSVIINTASTVHLLWCTYSNPS